MRSALILGAGYVGERVAELGRKKKYAEKIITSSRGESSSDRVFFNLENEESWKNLPTVETTFWTFPATPLQSVELFLNQMGGRIGKIIVIGSTSAFLTKSPDEEVFETTARDLSEPRVRGEEEIRQRGGIIVSSSGIYGPARNPQDWVKSGRVRASSRYVNFIHVDDLAEILWAAALQGRHGAYYTASDGRPFRWSELIAKWQLPSASGEESSVQKPSKRVNSQSTLDELKVRLKYQNVLDGVAVLTPNK